MALYPVRTGGPAVGPVRPGSFVVLMPAAIATPMANHRRPPEAAVARGGWGFGYTPKFWRKVVRFRSPHP